MEKLRIQSEEIETIEGGLGNLLRKNPWARRALYTALCLSFIACEGGGSRDKTGKDLLYHPDADKPRVVNPTKRDTTWYEVKDNKKEKISESQVPVELR